MQTSMNAGTEDAGTDNAAASATARGAAAAAAVDRDVLAGLAKLRGEPAAEKPAEAKPDPKPDAGEQLAEAKPDAKPLDEVPLDDRAKARLAAEQARDRKHKESVTKDRADIDAAKAKIEAEWKPRVEKAEAFEALKGGGVQALLRAAELLELTEDD